MTRKAKKLLMKKINLSEKEKEILRKERERVHTELEKMSRLLLNELIEKSIEMEEFSRDPEKLRQLKQEYENIKARYDKTMEELSNLDSYGLPLKDKMLREILSRKIGSEFVTSKKGALIELNTRLKYHESEITSLEKRLKNAPADEATVIKNKIELLKKRKKRIEKAIDAESKRKNLS